MRGGRSRITGGRLARTALLAPALVLMLPQGWDLFGTAFFEPSLDWIPPSALWSIQVGAVVVGHIVGA